jgi:SAM-dependent methyltransferase
MHEDQRNSAVPGPGTSPEPWNHNVHYHRVILDSVPPGGARALDVGCGTGALTRRLRRSVPHVTGVDRDERSIELARAHPGGEDIDYLLADFMASPFEPESFDLITSIASLHHMDAEAALMRMRDLLRPGGVLAVIGVAGGISPAEIGLVVPAAVGNQLHRAASARQRRSAADRAAAYQPPVIWPPPLAYRDTRRLAARLLPGARYRRRLYWRYSLIWVKPTENFGS